ncbi:HAD superfamily hydrolase (TIGR01493 family)/HAD superfamily hydrolase (TIGR01509 family)/HAD superfamily hydrolase (TIGR01549 family) [Nocardia tenerifensis]|uniref:HAD superfamily hydrolase (TIGR01493 family)/HAD superfamily hydrolase (TIGR01509 family)/HAD superfamily hydrolase (TIGR01549 family) n=1 Tax=Nocardia tenerifensis TaxID=228006 RepID=A0A318K4W2_9NOCA|nr:HAD-IA family hydrolase [Nocardia tenerifensis]PXX57917.1 HAD superfamily hydrolase (TIGR01493 family)/HAD superfamily hydrolase (TIGR01509 family)/HAD superfamily hydrolase (TIGR01549 family) [Nocardia tenerifensis]
MTIEAVLFDYSGTLFRLEEDESWGDQLVAADGRPFDVHEKAEILRRMTAPVEQIVRFGPDGQYAWDNRDLDPKLHRRAYLEVLRKSGVPTDEQAEVLYGRLIDPMAWTPYPDVDEVLTSLAAQGLQIAVVSNIAFDIRPAFAARNWDRYIDAFALSFEVGAMKPDPRIFAATLDKLGVDPAAALMVGDSAEADGGATALGCRFALVDPLPTAERRSGLLDALRDNGIPRDR